MIYFVQAIDGGNIKIGTTIRLSQRLSAIQGTIKKRLKLLGIMDGGYVEERAIHKRFAQLREDGEWFRPSEELLSFIDFETAQWDGTDEVHKYVTVKIDTDLIPVLRIAAAMSEQKIQEYLSDLVNEHSSKKAGRKKIIRKPPPPAKKRGPKNEE